MVKGNYKHGLTNKPIYIRWKAIKDRCYNSNYAEFNYYGGRGIRMADIWVNNPKSFYDYVVSLENSLKSGFSLDRINNDGNYEPGNLRWATKHIQATNQRMYNCNKTGFKGVNKIRERFRSRIRVNKELIHIGYYDTPELAHQSRVDYIKANNLNEYL